MRVLPLQQVSEQTDRPEFWHGGQLIGYLVQIQRSRSEDTCSDQGEAVLKQTHKDFYTERITQRC